MQIEILPNENCPEDGQFMFVESGKPRKIKSIMAYVGGEDVRCRIAGVYDGGVFGDAWAVQIDDSGEGTAYLIYGGQWGIRLSRGDADPTWDVADKGQIGEAYRIYASEDDIEYAE